MVIFTEIIKLLFLKKDIHLYLSYPEIRGRVLRGRVLRTAVGL